MKLNIYRIPAGIYAANCYVIFSDDTKSGIVVDPGGSADEIIDFVEKNNIDLKYIVLTHGHGDHIGGVKEIKDKYKIPVLIHEDDADMLTDASKNLSGTMASGPIEINADKTLKDGEIIKFGDLEALVLHTPGHTKGGICLKIQDHILTGDTLFKGSIGRTDLYSGDYETLIKSIKTKLLVLSDELIVLPGHGQPSTIRNERLSNPFFN
jgi:glyoxylase-like metal-dependent hydrolase (beta-lactamase superfamily II)